MDKSKMFLEIRTTIEEGKNFIPGNTCEIGGITYRITTNNMISGGFGGASSRIAMVAHNISISNLSFSQGSLEKAEIEFMKDNLKDSEFMKESVNND